MPIITGCASSGRGFALRRWPITWRVSAIDSCALLATSRSNSAFGSRTSTESRMATTVAARGSPVMRLISPIVWPRPISRTSRSAPSASRT